MRYESITRPDGAFQQALTAPQVVAVCRRGFGREPVSAVELGGGSFNTTYRVDLGGETVILRVAPARSYRIERDFMRHEHASLPFFAPIADLMPRTLFVDFTHDLVPRDYTFQTMLGGVSGAEGFRALTDKPGFFRQVGEIVRVVHEVRGERFGRPAGPTHATWSEAVLSTVDDTVADIRDAGLDDSDMREVGVLAAKNAAVLDGVTEPRLLHGDLWVPNVRLDGERIVGVFDHDRASWGDPAADWSVYEAGRKPGTARDAFWDTYGRPSTSPGAVWRSALYRAVHLGAVRIERHRLGLADTIPANYEDMARVLAELR
ncbi:aminoglycoside phosphotransferase family protein [Kutzneria sp. NPDC051319]|uniref:phosphotransferase family protein n=1 Tax=Kutzneria sp. NPDC051319 TaxID=3155047 RepID=UPI0034484142